MDFITIRFLDFIDIFLVAFLLYEVYMVIKGSIAINIFVILFSTYLVWLLVRALNMQLLSSILGQIMGVGVIALIIVFQQEIRRFLLTIGRKYFSGRRFSIESLISMFSGEDSNELNIADLLRASEFLSKEQVGALFVIAGKSNLDVYAETGEIIRAEISTRLLETIFYKNSPMHDGAVIIVKDKIFAAGCILPVSDDKALPKRFGLRHRAGLGIAEITDAFVIIISEETGSISYCHYGTFYPNITVTELKYLLEKEFVQQKFESK